MADAPVEFDQSKFFDQSNPLLNAVLQNVASFAGDLSGGLGTLVEFLNLTKIYLLFQILLTKLLKYHFLFVKQKFLN